MAGIIFPNVANALVPLIQMDRMAERDRLDRERQSRMDDFMVQDRRQARDLQQMQVLQALDDKQRARLRETAEWTTRSAMSVLNAPPESRAAAYQMAIQEGKTLGYDVSKLPPQYSPGMEGMLQFYAGKSAEYLKMLGDRPTPMGAPSAAPTAAPPNRDSFIQSMTPHAMDVAKMTGLDPRLVLAQAALETGYGANAPGNNFFGIKSHGQSGGQMLATTEAGPGGMAPTQASFRTYPDPGASARDYADFLKTNSRFAPVLAAQGLDAQIDAMGSSGYATDPQYGAKLRQIAQGLPQPGGGFSPTNMPAQSIPGGLPQVAQGDAITGQGDAPPRGGNPADIVRGVQLPPGARIMAQKGVPIVKDGTVLILKADGTHDFVPLPQRKDPGAAAGGPFAGNSVEAQALNMLVNNGTLTVQQAAELAAGKTITNPADGSVIFMTPSGLFRQPAPGGPTPQGQPIQPGNIPVTPPRPMTEGQANAALYADRMRSAEKIIAENEKAGLDVQGKILEQVPLGNYLQSESYQKLEQARRDFINAVLRRESGAVISDQEFENARIQYFPRPGDTPGILKQKAENRRIALEGISRAAGPTYKGAEDTPKPDEKAKRQFDIKKKYGLE